MPAHDPVSTPAWRIVLGWLAVALNAATACLWAFWGAIEGFHEGWWHASLAANIAFTLAYLIPAAIFVSLGLIAIRWPRVGAVILIAFTVWFWWWWDVPSRVASGDNPLPTIVLSGAGGFLAALWWVGRPAPRRWARRATWSLPLLVAFVSAAEPAYRVSTRHDDGIRAERVIEGAAVALTWAPSGPGWPHDHGSSWHDAAHAAAYLSRDGSRLLDEPQHAWRLPTIDEIARSMTRRARNAGGAWDAERSAVSFRTPPDKESPLWNPRSPIIYWWAADEADPDRAWTIAYNGFARPRDKSSAMGSLGFRLVRRESAAASPEGP